MIVVLSSSLRTDSHSRLLALEAGRALAAAGMPAEFVDLRDFSLPFCDGEAAYAHAETKRLADRLRAADGLIVATPVYNYDANAALKNAIELTGDAWEDKVVGFLCAAGGMASYMSVMALANSLMLDFRSVIVPRFVYATDRNFANGEIRDTDVRRRVAELAQATARLSTALRPAA